MVGVWYWTYGNSTHGPSRVLGKSLECTCLCVETGRVGIPPIPSIHCSVTHQSKAIQLLAIIDGFLQRYSVSVPDILPQPFPYGRPDKRQWDEIGDKKEQQQVKIIISTLEMLPERKDRCHWSSSITAYQAKPFATQSSGIVFSSDMVTKLHL